MKYSTPPPPQCLRIGVQEDIFVFHHIQAFGKHKNLQLGQVKLHSASELGVQEDIIVFLRANVKILTHFFH